MKLLTKEQMDKIVDRVLQGNTTIVYEAHQAGINDKTLGKYIRQYLHPELGPGIFPSEHNLPSKQKSY